VPFSSPFAPLNCDWVSGRFVAGFGGRQEREREIPEIRECVRERECWVAVGFYLGWWGLISFGFLGWW
jgi:hypothetical protein